MTGTARRAACAAILAIAGSIARGDTPHRHVTVGAFDYYPAIFKGDDGAVDGIYAEMLREIEKHEPLRFSYVWGSWANGLKQARDRKVDLLTSVAWTDERAEYLDYCSVPALTVWGELYQRADRPRYSIDSLNGRKIGVMSGDYNGKMYRERIEDFGITCSYVEYPSFEEVMRRTADGSVDAGVTSVLYGEAKYAAHGLIATGFAFAPFEIYFAAPKGTNADLLKTIDRYLVEWKNDPASVYYQARYKWSGRAVETKFPPWLGYAALAVIVLAVLSIAFNLMLRIRVRAVTRSLRNSERELTGKNQFITLLLDSTIEGILAFDSDNRCMMCNASLLRLLGLKEEGEVIGRPVNEILVPADGAAIGSLCDGSSGASGNYLAQTRILRQDGGSLYAELWSWPLLAEGSAVGTIVIVIDMTDRMSAEKNRAEKEIAERSNEAKSEFIAKMSHELRTPLNSVIVLTGILQRHLSGSINPRDYSYLSVIERNGMHLLEQIDEILDISRIESGNEKIALSERDLAELTRECVASIEPLVLAKSLSIEIAGGEGLRVTTDAGKLRHVLTNILMNAVKYTANGGISVRLRGNGDRAFVEITDTGVGIDADHLPHIFDEFYQIAETSTFRQGGVGLGLAIARRYAELLGGTVTATSAKGTGSTFTVAIPLSAGRAGAMPDADTDATAERKPEPDAKEPEAAAGASSAKRDRRALIIDDNRDSRISEEALLSDYFAVTACDNGYDGIKSALADRPDFILLDVSMPIFDGFATLRAIRSTETLSSIFVVAVTASTTAEERESILRSGFDAFVPKPIRFDALKAALWEYFR